MTIPKLPTDNLYKFISLFGLTLIVSYLFLGYNNESELQKETNNLKYEVDLISFEIESVNNERKEYIKNIAELCETEVCDCRIIKKSNYNIQLSFKEKGCDSNGIIDEIIKLQDLIKIDSRKVYSKIDTITAKENLIARKKEIYILQENKIFVFFIVGITMAIIGFLMWYFKVQKYEDLILKKQSEDLKNDIEK
jgi:hypothetical protein